MSTSCSSLSLQQHPNEVWKSPNKKINNRSTGLKVFMLVKQHTWSSLETSSSSNGPSFWKKDILPKHVRSSKQVIFVALVDFCRSVLAGNSNKVQASESKKSKRPKTARFRWKKNPSENDHHFSELGVKIGVRRSRSMDALEDILLSYGLCRWLKGKWKRSKKIVITLWKISARPKNPYLLHLNWPQFR